MPSGLGRRRGQSSGRGFYTRLLRAVVVLIFLYAVGIVLWQNSRLNRGGVPDLASVLSSSKEAFVSPGGGWGSRKAASGGAGWLPGNLLGEDGAYPYLAESEWDGADAGGGEGGPGAVVPVDLTVNFLANIQRAPGAPPEPPLPPSASSARSPEDFLPVVAPSEVVFRWAHAARAGSRSRDARAIRAYRIVVRRFRTGGGGGVVWTTGRIDVDEGGAPGSVEWGESAPRPEPGQILEWSVEVWDANDVASSSDWSKFAIGPRGQEEWEGKWIAHPSDMDTFDRTKGVAAGRNASCELWKRRRPLPLFRARIAREDLAPASPTGEVGPDDSDEIASALLVMSGLGSFRASFDGVPLSTSGPVDPPFTDYSKRVMYRGFDVTPFLQGDEEFHVIGATMGSGWWDHRPVSGMAKPQLLPRGPATVIAQVILTYASGKTRVVGKAGVEGGSWQVARGHIRESDLFTGEMVDLGVLGAMEGWDTAAGWGAVSTTANYADGPHEEIDKWVLPTLYHTEVTSEERVQEMSLKAKAMDPSEKKNFPRRNHFAAPVGELIPHEIPPVMAVERIAPDEVHDLGGGRWLLDYGKAFSGMLHFDEGVPAPIVPKDGEYPRAHGFKVASEKGDSFMTVIYGESLEMTTGDINRVLVAGLGQHDGGPRHISKKEGHTKNAYCFPDDHDNILSQKDVYVVSKAFAKAKEGALFAKARQSHFTTHSFRFAEVCCSATPPKNAHALVYRTAVNEWGAFDSSNVLVNGGYELVKNAMVSNMLSVQSDCPHREKLPYGGDLVADSPAAMHMFDMSAFYGKTVQDWLDAQWGNGAYTETSVWQDLNDYAGIGHGAGETVWATAPPVLTVRHMQHYGDTKFLERSLASHVRWVDFLDEYFEAGMLKKDYDPELDSYYGQKSGLGDWLAMRSRDTFLTHTAFYMAAGRCIAYIAHKVGAKDVEEKGLAVAKKIRDRIVRLYLKNGKDNFDFPHGSASHTPGPEMSLFSRIVPGEKRCVVLKNWFQRSGHTWPGDEERRFVNALSEEDKNMLIESGELTKRGREYAMGWSQWQGFNEGIFAIRYALKTLSDNGFHHIALRKAAGVGMATSEYMLRHNATTLWESWWRSEDLYSRNHPMLGALAEWMSSSVAGVSHYPTSTGGRTILFWPRFPKSATTLEYASATQGTVRGDYSVAWRFEGLPSDKKQHDSATVSVRVRFVVPPGGEGVYRPPLITSLKTRATLRHAIIMPDLTRAKSLAREVCINRRQARMGFSYSWEYDRSKEQWYKYENGKAIGTPCESYLFHSSLDETKWAKAMHNITSAVFERTDTPIAPGFYEVVFTNWKLEKEVEGTGRIGNLPEYYTSNDLGPYCKDSSTFEWDIDDGTHII